MDGQPLKPREWTSKWTRHRAVCCVPRTAIGRRYVTELWDLERTLFKTVPNTYPTCPMIRTFYLRHDTVWPTISCLISERFYRTTGAHLSYALLSSPSIFFFFERLFKLGKRLSPVQFPRRQHRRSTARMGLENRSTHESLYPESCIWQAFCRPW